MTIQDFLQRLTKVRKAGKNWQACCPAHEDRNPSLSISEGDDGQMLLHCFGGCSTEAVLDALGLTKKDLFPDSSVQVPRQLPRSTAPTEKNKRGNLHATPEAAAKAAAMGLKRIHGRNYAPVGCWEYRDAGGLEVGRVYRFEVPGEGRSSKQYRPVYRDGAGWRIGDPPGGFPLYRLPEPLSSSGPVFITEGEKAADALAQLGLTVTTSAHGAQSAHKGDWSALAARDVYVLPDNDPPRGHGHGAGRQYTDRVASCLLKLTPPARPRLLELPGLPPKGDAVEFVQQHKEAGQTDQEIRSTIVELAGRATEFPPPALESEASESLPRVFLHGGARNVRVSDNGAALGRLFSGREEVFVHARLLVRVGTEDHGKVRLISIPISALPSLFEGVASLYTTRRLRDGTVDEIPANCSKQQAELIAECKEFLDALPVIRVLTQCPVMIEYDGKLETVVGYHRPTGIYAGGRALEEVPLGEAAALLTELLQDFYFVAPTDRSRALAALLTPALVHGGLLPERAPITILEADSSQTGKGYLVRLDAAIYGDTPGPITQRKGGTGSLEESMSQCMLEGASFISIDNVRGKLDSPALESALTEDSFLARAPYSKAVPIDLRRTTIMLTSNKAELTPDLANRGNPVRLLKQPEGYQFKQFPGGRTILEHVRLDQGLYLGAVFTVLRAWWEESRPRISETRHDFRPWAGSLGWIVENVLNGAPLCEGLKEVKTRMTNSALNWLRDAAHVVLQAGQADSWLRTNQIVALLQETGVEIPGLSEGADLNDENDAKKAYQATGSRLASCFRTADQIAKDGAEITVVQIDGMTVERRSTHDEQERRTTRSYCFGAASTKVDTIGAIAQTDSSRLSLPIQSSTVQEESCACVAPTPAATPAPTKTLITPTAPTGCEHFTEDCEMTVVRDCHTTDFPESMGCIGAQAQPGAGETPESPRPLASDRQPDNGGVVRRAAGGGWPTHPVTGRAPSMYGADEWVRMYGWVNRVTPADLPPASFSLNRHCVVNDSKKFLESLSREVAQGPRGPRARTGALQCDIELLKHLT